VKSKTWSRSAAIVSVRRDIWRFLTQAARTDDEVVLEAAALLQMPAREVRTLARLQFVLSDDVATLLARMPDLVRRLTNTTAHEIEASAERLRGPVLWSETYAARAASGLSHAYATAPTRRAFDTPENRLLAFDLDAIASVGRDTGWHRSSSEGAGSLVRERTSEAVRWRATRALQGVVARPPSAADLQRVRGTRKRRHYQPALDVYALYQRYLRRLDRDAIRNAVQSHALVTSRDPVLLELHCLFEVIRALRRQGWSAPPSGLVATPLVFRGRKQGTTVDVYYQHAPPALTVGSLYREIQKSHAFAAVGGLIPDLVLRFRRAGGPMQWVLVEVKGVERPVQASAREAARDLFSYRRALSPVLGKQPGPYGIGIAWGEDLEPSPSAEVVLCSPDRLDAAIEFVSRNTLA
jgi:hypothetical protein